MIQFQVTNDSEPPRRRNYRDAIILGVALLAVFVFPAYICTCAVTRIME